MSPNGLITITALLFVGMCFALAAGAFWVAIGVFVAMGLTFIVGVHWLTQDDS
jgi:hypothetical protein